MANMFRCGGGDNGGETLKSIIVVTTESEEFEGLTVNCIGAGQSYASRFANKTCSFEVPYTGIYTISVTYEGDLFEESVTVDAIPSSFNVEINSAPIGSEVLPINDVQVWLKCASISVKSYTTISQVLADTSTLNKLLSNDNANDYLVRSTNFVGDVCANQSAMTYIGLNNYSANLLLANSTWLTAICNSAYFEKVLNVSVPTMTSNTKPKGQAFASGNNNYHPAYYAFDKQTSTNWCIADGTTGGTLGYAFDTAVAVKKIYIKSLMNTHRYKFKVQYSDNGTSWIDSNLANATATEVGVYFNLNSGSHRWWRIYITTTADTNNTTMLNFYGR